MEVISFQRSEAQLLTFGTDLNRQDIFFVLVAQEPPPARNGEISGGHCEVELI